MDNVQKDNHCITIPSSQSSGVRSSSDVREVVCLSFQAYVHNKAQNSEQLVTILAEFISCLQSTMQQYQDLKLNAPKIRHCTTCLGLLGHHELHWYSGELLCYWDGWFKIYDVSK
jgi:hypothetical protein